MLKALLAFSLATTFCFADEIRVRAPNGEELFVEVDPQERFGDVVSRLHACLKESESLDAFCLDFQASSSEQKSLPWRDYYRENSKEDTANLSFIICTMGFKSIFKIFNERKALKSAGDKIDHLHPLRFVMGIFTDEEMKAAMHNIKGRTLVWDEFKKGLYTSLAEETKKNNMHLEYIEHFAKRVQVDSNLIIRPLQQQKWEEFMNILLKHVPRKGDPKRYDM